MFKIKIIFHTTVQKSCFVTNKCKNSKIKKITNKLQSKFHKTKYLYYHIFFYIKHSKSALLIYIIFCVLIV